MSYRVKYRRGQWKADCDRCGFTYPSGKIRKEWTGLRVCTGSGTNNCWEERHSQDFVRGVRDRQAPPWTRPAPATDYGSNPTITFTSATTASVTDDATDATTLYTAAATSSSGGSITFSLLADPDGRFEITAAGVLTLQTGKTLDASKDTSHVVVVQADDAFATAILAVTLTVSAA